MYRRPGEDGGEGGRAKKRNREENRTNTIVRGGEHAKLIAFRRRVNLVSPSPPCSTLERVPGSLLFAFLSSSPLPGFQFPVPRRTAVRVPPRGKGGTRETRKSAAPKFDGSLFRASARFDGFCRLSEQLIRS